jgi:hypothetical protein
MTKEMEQVDISKFAVAAFFDRRNAIPHVEI